MPVSGSLMSPESHRCTDTARLPQPTFDAYRDGDEVGILTCMRAAFGVDVGADRWEHLHRRNPAGPSWIVLARSADTVIGQMARLRRIVRFFGVDHRAAHVLDTMTHPDWQRRGIYRRLIELSDAVVDRDGIAISYGVANANSLRAATTYEGRRPLGSFPVLVRSLRPLASVGAVFTRIVNAGGAQALVEAPDCAAAGPVAVPADAPSLSEAAGGGWTAPRFDARHSDLFVDAEAIGPIAFVRDADHLAWRYPAGPRSPYLQRDAVADDRVAATIVVRLVALGGLRILFVMDWHWRTGAARAGRELLGDAIALAKRVDAHGVAAMAASGSPHRTALRRSGFLVVPPWAFPKQASPGVRTHGRHVGDPRWETARNWYFTWGDGLTL